MVTWNQARKMASKGRLSIDNYPNLSQSEHGIGYVYEASEIKQYFGDL